MTTTAAEYRRYAQECIQSARDAQTEPVRRQFLSLAKLWMTAAKRMDAQTASRTNSKSDGHALADNGVVRPDDPI